MRRAYAAAEEGGLQAAYEDVRWRTRAARPLLALADRLYPMGGAVQLAGELDRRIRTDGLSPACAAAVDRLGLECDFVMSDATRDALASAPAVVYGNHPTLLTPFLVGAAVEREDVRFFMLSYVGHLIPGMRSYMLPLEIPSRTSWIEWQRGGNRRVVAHWLTKMLEKGRERNDTKPTNHQILGRGAQHVASGGCVVIFPDGGCQRDGAWYPGIGQLAGQLARGPQAGEILLVPMREEGSSSRHVYAGLRHMGGRARDGELPRIRLRFAEPHRLSDLVSPADSGRAIVARLQRHYRSIFPTPKLCWRERLFFPWRLAWGRHRT